MEIEDYISELKHLVETVEVQRNLYQQTDQDEWHLEGGLKEEGPVNEEIARYNIGPLDYFMELWNETHDAAKDLMNPGEVEKTDQILNLYREIEKKIFDNSDFLEDIYDLDKPLGAMKVEARYS